MVTQSGVIVYQYDSPIFFGNAAHFQQMMSKLEMQLSECVIDSKDQTHRALVLDCASVAMIDTTGAQALRDTAVRLAKKDICTSHFYSGIDTCVVTSCFFSLQCS